MASMLRQFAKFNRSGNIITRVIPAEAGIHSKRNHWIPDKCYALSGMT
jgi:hypothetical protein